VLGADAEAARLKLDEGGEAAFPRSNIRRAKLVLTDELIAATAALAGVQGEAESDSDDDQDTDPTGSPDAEGAPGETVGETHPAGSPRAKGAKRKPGGKPH
jgi:hypothetical protein